MRGRGLKLFIKMSKRSFGLVAPHAGAWIETALRVLFVWPRWSPPMRGRGLKQRRRRHMEIGGCRPPCEGVG